MNLLHLELTPPPSLTALNEEGELACTLVRLAAASLTVTAAEQLASCIEEEAQEAAGASDHSSGGGGSAVFALPLPPGVEAECCSQLFVFGATVRACVRACVHACVPM